jgi:hypothetical protein
MVKEFGSVLTGMSNFYAGGYRHVMNWGNMKASLKYFNLWIPFVYTMAMSGIALYAWGRSPVSGPAGFPAFIAFLPMAFFFSALCTQNHISRLEKRIASLEKPPGLGTGEISH